MTQAVILTHARTGGTFLCSCLSNHPDVFCDRGEPLGYKGSAWRYLLGCAPEAVLEATLSARHYDARVCKVIWGKQLTPPVWDWLVENQPKVIWLYRENSIRQATSALFRIMTKQKKIRVPAHTREPVMPAQAYVDPEQLLSLAWAYEQGKGESIDWLSVFREVMPLTYAQMMGGERVSATRIQQPANDELCDFLGVERRDLWCKLVAVNPYRMSEAIVNWDEVRVAIEASDFAHMLGDEL